MTSSGAADPAVDRRAGIPHVVICGAGFGGLWAARALAGKHVQVTLVDRTNYHTFLPLLYQVAAAELGPSDIAYPIRSTLRGAPNVAFRMAEVTDVDVAAREVVLGARNDGTDGSTVSEGAERLPYEYLILAPGSVPNFFGVEGAAEHAWPLRTMEHAIPLRHHVLSCFEAAAHEPDAARRARLLTFAIVGGGPTGVEYAGALAELLFGPLLEDFRGIEKQDVRVVLIESGDGVLAGFPQRLRDYAKRRLEKRNVTVRLNALATRVTAASIELKDGTIIPTETVVWTAGVKGAQWLSQSGLPRARGGRVRVTPELRVVGSEAADADAAGVPPASLPPTRTPPASARLHGPPNVYVVGDLALIEGQETLPQVAQVAMQTGTRAAKNILARIRGQAEQPFEYVDYGMLAVIGRNAAVADMGPLHFKGFSAWLLWIAIHVAKLIGFRNRVLVLVNWAWNYLRFRRAVRLILPAEGRASTASSSLRGSP